MLGAASSRGCHACATNVTALLASVIYLIPEPPRFSSGPQKPRPRSPLQATGILQGDVLISRPFPNSGVDDVATLEARRPEEWSSEAGLPHVVHHEPDQPKMPAKSWPQTALQPLVREGRSSDRRLSSVSASQRKHTLCSVNLLLGSEADVEFVSGDWLVRCRSPPFLCCLPLVSGRLHLDPFSFAISSTMLDGQKHLSCWSARSSESLKLPASPWPSREGTAFVVTL